MTNDAAGHNDGARTGFSVYGSESLEYWKGQNLQPQQIEAVAQLVIETQNQVAAHSKVTEQIVVLVRDLAAQQQSDASDLKSSLEKANRQFEMQTAMFAALRAKVVAHG